MSVTPDNVPHRFRLAPNIWRKFTILAGLLLVGTCFMPAVQCNLPLVPTEHMRKLGGLLRSDYLQGRYGEISGQRVPWGASPEQCALCHRLECMYQFLVYVAPYAFGVLIALAALARWFEWPYAHRVLSWVMLVLLAWCAGSLIYTSWAGYKPADADDEIVFTTDWPWTIPCIVVPCVVLIYLAAATRLRKSAYWCYVFIGLLATLAWGVRWLCYEYVMYGIKVAVAACGACLICTIGEVRALTRRSWLSAVWRLATCRLDVDAVTGPFCPECGYCVIGLPEQRCPECGQSFTLEETNGVVIVRCGNQGRVPEASSPGD